MTLGTTRLLRSSLLQRRLHRRRLRHVVLLAAAALCGARVDASAQTPLPLLENSNLRLGYYYADGRGGDDTARVAPYTNIYLANPTGYDTNQLDWQTPFRASLQAAVLRGERIYLMLADGIEPDTGRVFSWDAVLNIAAPFWSSVDYVEVQHEGLPTQLYIEGRIVDLNAAFASHGLAARPIGATVNYADTFTTPIINAAGLSFINIEGYLSCPGGDPATDAATLTSYLAAGKARVESAGRSVFLTMQAYDRLCWTNIDGLVALQAPVYLAAYNDPSVLGVFMFSYNRGGGTKFYPPLEAVHRQIGSVMRISPRMAVTSPASGTTVVRNRTFTISGWAIDRAAWPGTGGTGVDTLHVWAQKPGASAIFLGVAAYGTPRSDVAALYGSQFTNSGFSLATSIPVPGNYSVVVFSHSAVSNTFNITTTFQMNVTDPPVTDLTRPGDFDNDLISEMTAYNTTSGVWSSLLSSSSFATLSSHTWGGSGYTPAPGDYDGDGKADLGVYVQSTGVWNVLLSGANFTTALPPQSAGGPGWIPVPGDYDGDHKTDIAVYNTTTGVWYWLKSSTNYTTSSSVTYGGTGWTAVPADFDGDGKIDVGVYQSATGTWSVPLSSTNFTTSLTQYPGGPGWAPVPGDFDGDGKADFAVYNETTATWYGLKSSTNYTTSFNIGWGGTGYAPVKGDFDGDGKADIATYRESTGVWNILLSGANYTTAIAKTLGGTGWVPVPRYPQ